MECMPAVERPILRLPRAPPDGCVTVHIFYMAEITKSYEPKDVEDKWYAAWQEAKCFAGHAAPGQ